jgi:hypothetical protein
MTVEFVYCFAEADVVHLADEADNVAAGVAPETVVKAGLGIDGKGRGLLLVEGTETDVIGALLLERDAVSLDNRLKVVRLLDLLDLLF